MHADGQILAPFTWLEFTLVRSFTVDPPEGYSFGLARFVNPSLTPVVEEEKEEVVVKKDELVTPAATVTPATTSPAAVPGAAPVVARRCLSRRSLTLRLRTGRRRSEQSAIVSATVTVNGKRVTPRRRGATVNLRNLPKGRYSVVIRLRLADGGRVRDVRRYRTCAQKIERELAPLRTRPQVR